MDEDASLTPRGPFASRLSTPHEDSPATSAQPISATHRPAQAREGNALFARAVGYDPTSDGGGISPTATPLNTSAAQSFLGPETRYNARPGPPFPGMSEISPTAGGNVMQQQQQQSAESRHTSISTAETVRGGHHGPSQRRFFGGFERRVPLSCVFCKANRFAAVPTLHPPCPLPRHPPSSPILASLRETTASLRARLISRRRVHQRLEAIVRRQETHEDGRV